MRDRITKLRTSAVDLWNRLSRRQRIIMLLAGTTVPLGIIAALVYLFTVASGPKMVPLFTGLAPQDAAAIVKGLKKSNTPYELEANGTAIMVNQKDVFEKRLELAATGLPAGGTIGFELFDQTRLGMTDFTQQINFRRAIEGELSRTIMSLEAVENARVLVVMPEPSLFVTQQEKASASVALKFKRGKDLTPDQVQGIMHLVAASVKGLDPKDVTVVDARGNLLSEFDKRDQERARLQLNDLQLKQKIAIEDRYKQKIQAALNKVLGEPNVEVVVSAELDWDEHSTEDEVYEPVVGDNGVVRSEQQIEEKYLGTGTVPEIGVPGTTSNIPGYKGLTEGNAEYNRSEATRNYEITKHLDKKNKNQGDIRSISVSVMLNKDVKDITARTVADIRESVGAAANLNFVRGDKVSVISIRFSPEGNPFASEFARDQRLKRYLKIAYLVLIFLSLLAIMLLTWMALRTAVVPEPETETWPIDEESHLEEPVPVEELLLPELSEEQRMREKIREEVLRMVHDDPEGASLIVRSWLFED